MYKEYDTIKCNYTLDLNTISFHQWNHPDFQPQEFTQKIFDKIKKYIYPDNVVVDIGSHVGWLSTMYALRVGVNGELHCFEPNKFVFNILTKNLKTLYPDNITKRPLICRNNIAVSDSCKSNQSYWYIDFGLCNGGYNRIAGPVEYKVSTIDLDGYFGYNYKTLINFIKIDTEGHEEEILRGASKTIEFSRPNMMLELYKFSTMDRRESLYDLLCKMGYDCYNFTKAHYDVDRLGRIMSKEEFFAAYDTTIDLFCKPV